MSYAPHIRSKRTTKALMLDVVIALMPALIAGIYFFGLPALIHTLTCVASCIFFEYIWEKLFKLPNTAGDFSAVITGMLIAFNVPASLPWWMCLLGGVFAIIVVKMVFGGIGNNFVNPALAARAFLLASFPVAMTMWTKPPPSPRMIENRYRVNRLLLNPERKVPAIKRTAETKTTFSASMQRMSRLKNREPNALRST